jgi:hypothetical protein
VWKAALKRLISPQQDSQPINIKQPPAPEMLFFKLCNTPCIKPEHNSKNPETKIERLENDFCDPDEN